MALSCSSQSVLPTTSFRLVLRLRVDVGVAKTPVSERAQRAADAVHAEGVERVVVAERVLELGAGEERNDAGEDADDDRAGGA